MKPYLLILILLLFLSNQVVMCSESKFVTIPATSYEIVDGLTGIKVTISVSEFLISKTEVTQEEFFEIMHFNPSYHRSDKRPVENVSWWQAIQYCNLKSIKDRLQPCYNLVTGECDFSRNGYRLPTDAEWNLAGSDDTKPDPKTVHKYANVGSTSTKDVTGLLKLLQETGTTDIASYPPNKFGLYDMLGNVWEWCYDYYSPIQNQVTTLKDPYGPSWGLTRIIRGGSFISLVHGWSTGYRSSIEPDYKSRFTGFRLCRSTPNTRCQPLDTHPSIDARPSIEVRASSIRGWDLKSYNNVPNAFKNNTGGLSSLVVDAEAKTISTVTAWYKQKRLLKDKWSKLLGAPTISPPAPASTDASRGSGLKPDVRLIKTFEEDDYIGKLMYLRVEPDHWEKIFLMMPNKLLKKPAPAVIVPYYDVDTPAGRNMGGDYYEPMGITSFAHLMVQQGYIAVAVKWFGESYGERWAEAVANLKLKYPECTGLGKWVWDAQRVVDYLYSLPEVDNKNIGIMGHSLGAKMAIYAAAMDERITAVVASEPAIGFDFAPSYANYDDYWYFGDFINNRDKSTDQHELLAMIAPRAFLLIGGDEADTDKSWYYINAAREVYSLFGVPQRIGYFNHRSGHAPTAESNRLSIEWLKHFLSD